jgi:anti-sigma factor RsiW
MSVNGWWRRLRCKRYEPALGLRALDLLAGGESAALEAHLTGCESCRTRLAELRATANGVRRWTRTMSLGEPPGSLRGRWESELRAEAARSGRHGPVPSARRGEAGGGSAVERPGWGGGRWAWATVAACWILVALLRLSAPRTGRIESGATARGNTVSLRDVALVLAPNGRISRAESEAGERARPPAPRAPAPRSEGVGPRRQA